VYLAPLVDELMQL